MSGRPGPGLGPGCGQRGAGWSAGRAGGGGAGRKILLGGWAGGSARPAALSAASLHGGPRALRPDPGAWVGTALTASSRLGDLGSVSSLLRASAPSYAHWGMLNRNPPGLA